MANKLTGEALMREMAKQVIWIERMEAMTTNAPSGQCARCGHPVDDHQPSGGHCLGCRYSGPCK